MHIIKSEEGEVFDIELEEDLLKKNREIADKNRETLDSHKVLAIDVMGSIGSGKTSLIEKLTKSLKDRYRISMIAGDLTTTIDADRIHRNEVEVTQINTGKECHLDANLIKKALNELDLEKTDLLFIENVGNLICPAEFPLGSHKRVVVISVSEGPYMVVKHPYIFIDTDLVVINKIDLASSMDVSPENLTEDVAKIKPDVKVAKTNCRTGEGIGDVIRGLEL